MEAFNLAQGPSDDSVLYDQTRHVTARVWTQEELYTECTARQSIDFVSEIPQQVELNLTSTGFLGLHNLRRWRLDHKLISALVERWRPETNTFHLPVGEATITLQDIEFITGTPVEGLPLTSAISVLRHEQWMEVVANYLGQVPPEGAIRKSGLKLSWIKNNICPEDYVAADGDYSYYTRGYMLLLLGGLFMSNKTGTHVPLKYLLLMHNFGQCFSYAWGAGILANIYRELGNASSHVVGDIAGACIVIQCWALTRFEALTPISLGFLRVPGDAMDFPVRLGEQAWSFGPSNIGHNCKHYRDQLSQVRDNEVHK